MAETIYRNRALAPRRKHLERDDVTIAVPALILPLFIGCETPWHRAVLMGIAAPLAFRYGYWHATETLAPAGLTVSCIAGWSLFALKALSPVGSTSAFAMMSRFRARSEAPGRRATPIPR